jgi:hypothetical protein
MKCPHTYNHYRESLIKACELKYHFLQLYQFEEIDNFNKVILLRHDIDFALDNALQIARLEQEIGIKSTFFIRTSGKYNIMYYPNQIIIREILSLGHEIGLHYSLEIPKLINESDEHFFSREKGLLEDVLGQNIKGICLHDPNSCNKLDIGLSKYNLLYDAYAEYFFSRLKYISDSRGSWREGCLCKNIGNVDKLYILTHPFWWYNHSSCENF